MNTSEMTAAQSNARFDQQILRERQNPICRSLHFLAAAMAANLREIKRRHDLSDKVPLIMPAYRTCLRCFFASINITTV